MPQNSVALCVNKIVDCGSQANASQTTLHKYSQNLVLHSFHAQIKQNYLVTHVQQFPKQKDMATKWVLQNPA